MEEPMVINTQEPLILVLSDDYEDIKRLITELSSSLKETIYKKDVKHLMPTVLGMGGNIKVFLLDSDGKWWKAE